MRYVIDPTSSLYRQVSEDSFTRPMAASVGSALYRFFGESNRLLYIGITSRPRERWYAHSRTAQWWPLVRAVEVGAERMPERRAQIAEWRAITDDSPAFNVAKTTSLTDQSLSDPTPLTEPSRITPIGKGREGKGREIGREAGTAAFHLTTKGLWITRRPADRRPMQTAIDGGVL